MFKEISVNGITIIKGKSTENGLTIRVNGNLTKRQRRAIMLQIANTCKGFKNARI